MIIVIATSDKPDCF